MDCHYCGMPADTKDHIIPISYNYAQRPTSHRSKGGITVDCCQECNSILSDKFLSTIQTRAAELAECLEVKYRKVLTAPVWSEEDLTELGPSLQKQVRAKQYLRDEVVERIRNCVSVSQELLEQALPLFRVSVTKI
jgi:hypothetical protein